MEILLLLVAGLAVGGATGWYFAEQRASATLQDVAGGWERKAKHLEAEVKTADDAHEETKKTVRSLQEQVSTLTKEKQALEKELEAHRKEGAASETLPRINVSQATPAQGTEHDLTQIKGIGKVVARKLGDVGIKTIDDLAKLEDSAISDVEQKLDVRAPVNLVAWRDAAREIHAR